MLITKRMDAGLNHSEMAGKCNLMDVTLRDGSYAVNFQFSECDTAILYDNLCAAGFEYIEIGHGMGLGAGKLHDSEALCSDEEYLQVVQSCNGTSRYGMFCIPGVAKLEDLELLDQYHASFVRVGTNINEVEKSKRYIEKAKEYNLLVMANYMKSYVATSEQFKECVRKSKEYGADVIYVVDSAGNMNVDDIARYYDAVQEIGDIQLGFHGHNNLGLAVSNSLFAMKLGFDFVDVSVSGMGRSSGNAIAELVVANIMKEDGGSAYDCKKIIEIANRYIKPIYKHDQLNALDIYSGIAGFHTSYMGYIHKYSSKYNVDPLDLIVEYAKIDKVNMEEGLLQDIAEKMSKVSKESFLEYNFNEYFGNEQMGDTKLNESN